VLIEREALLARARSRVEAVASATTLGLL